MVVQRLQAIALFVGPVVFAASPFFWVNGHYGVNGGMLIALSMVPWVYGLIGEYERLRERVPVAAGRWPTRCRWRSIAITNSLTSLSS